MKRILIIQNQLPAYRKFLWVGLANLYTLYLAEAESDELILPDGSITSFRNYKFNEVFDCLVLNGGIREFRKTIYYRCKYRSKSVLAWTQFVGKNKSLISRLIKSIYLILFFNRTLLYYDHEKRLIPFHFLRNKVVGLNNTVADCKNSAISISKNNSLLFIGRSTEKTRLTLLLEVAMYIENIELHLIGVSKCEVSEKYHVGKFVFHGAIQDIEKIEHLARDCTYFVYPGDVGLSIVHAVKLGLIPVIHANLDDHMPECRAVAETLPTIYFQKDEQLSLLNILKILAQIKPNEALKKLISSQAQEKFSQKTMIQNFSNAIEGH